MAIEFKLPDLGENIESADIVGVLVSVGDTIEVDQPCFEVETDKATVEVPSPAAGKVVTIHVSDGDSVSVGDLLITLEGDAGDGEAGGDAAESKSKGKAESAPEDKPASKSGDSKATSKDDQAQDDAPEQDDADAGEADADQPQGEAKPESKPESKSESESKSAGGKSSSSSGAERSTSQRKAPPRPGSAARGGERSATGPVPAGPATRRLARELGVEIHRVSGSGAGGRIEREDILNAVRLAMHGTEPNQPEAEPGAVTPPGEPEQDDFGVIHVEKLSKIRKTIAAKMTESISNAVHLTNFDEADVTDLEAMRQNLKADYEAADLKLTSLTFVVRAVVKALMRHPVVNATFDLANDRVLYKRYVNLGIAVDTDRGLVVPNIRNAEQLSPAQITRALAGLAQKVRSGDFSVDDLRGGSFTISNMGSIGGLYSTPIINYPEVAILLVGRSKLMPYVHDDEVKPRMIMPLSLSYDHRLVDGANASRFLNDVKAYLEQPERMMFAP